MDMMKHDVVEKVVYEENDCVWIMVEKFFSFQWAYKHDYVDWELKHMKVGSTITFSDIWAWKIEIQLNRIYLMCDWSFVMFNI